MTLVEKSTDNIDNALDKTLEKGVAIVLKFFRWSLMSLLVVVLLWIAPAAKADDTIRVLLKQNINNAEIVAVVEGGYHLLDGGTGTVLAELQPGEQWSIYREGLVLKAKSQGDGTELSFVGTAILKTRAEGERSVFRLGNIRYRGDLVFHRTDAGLMVVNTLPIEDYLYGVLPGEIGPSLPEEALKAQAVVCRTLAMFRKGKFMYYDVTAGTLDQVYGGYEAELIPGQERIWRAVDDTAGEMIYYDGKLIEAVFHSNAGGYTAKSQSIWGGDRPYLQSVPSPYDAYAAEYPYQTTSGWPASSYQWTKKFSPSELEDRIDTWNKAYPHDQIFVGRVVELRPYLDELPHDFDTDFLSGRVNKIDIVGTQGVVSFTGDKIRQVFGLKSNFFILEGGASLGLLAGTGTVTQLDRNTRLAVASRGGRLTPSTDNAIVVKGKNSSRSIKSRTNGFVFVGRGFGHGVGMSQWGATGMAEIGYNYQEIIEHYYNQSKFDGSLQIR